MVRIVCRPNEQIPDLRSKIEKIEKDAQRIQNMIQAQLGLKSNYAALKESHNSTILGIAVFGFTIVTIIFTPLSFLAALFALSIDRLENNKSSDTFNGTFSGTRSSHFDGVYSSGVYSTSYIGKYMGKNFHYSFDNDAANFLKAIGEIVSLAVTIILVWLAFVWFHRKERSKTTKNTLIFDPVAPAPQKPKVAGTQGSIKGGVVQSGMTRVLQRLHPSGLSTQNFAQGIKEKVGFRSRKAENPDAV